MTADGMDALSGRPDAGPAHDDEQKMDKVQDDDVQMMQEVSRRKNGLVYNRVTLIIRSSKRLLTNLSISYLSHPYSNRK